MSSMLPYVGWSSLLKSQRSLIGNPEEKLRVGFSLNKWVLTEPHLCTRQTVLPPVAWLSVPSEIAGIVELQNTVLYDVFNNRTGNGC